jgi:hypothetical protein
VVPVFIAPMWSTIRGAPEPGCDAFGTGAG